MSICGITLPTYSFFFTPFFPTISFFGERVSASRSLSLPVHIIVLWKLIWPLLGRFLYACVQCVIEYINLMKRIHLSIRTEWLFCPCISASIANRSRFHRFARSSGRLKLMPRDKVLGIKCFAIWCSTQKKKNVYAPVCVFVCFCMEKETNDTATFLFGRYAPWSIHPHTGVLSVFFFDLNSSDLYFNTKVMVVGENSVQKSNVIF